MALKLSPALLPHSRHHTNASRYNGFPVTLSVMVVYSIWTVAPHTIYLRHAGTQHTPIRHRVTTDEILCAESAAAAAALCRHSEAWLGSGFFYPLSYEVCALPASFPKRVLVTLEEGARKMHNPRYTFVDLASGFSFPNPNLHRYLRSVRVS